MIKKTMTYETFDGELATEDFYFNLSKAELLDMELTTGGFQKMITKLIDTQDRKGIVAIFKDILDLSYGVRSEDGRRFYKSDEILAEFKASQAYSDLYFELATSEEAGAEFINGVIPANLREQVSAEESKNEAAEPIAKKKPQDMSREELISAMREKTRKLNEQEFSD